MEKSTKHLIRNCHSGNPRAQMKLYSQYAGLLYGACLRIIADPVEAEEAMQDSFLKIFNCLGQYQDGQSFEAWIHRIAVNTAIDYIRRHHPEMEKLSSDNIPDTSLEESGEEDIDYTVRRIKEIMQKLPPGYRVILTLYLFEGYDMEEIASILDIKPPTVRSQYLRGKRRLQELMKTEK